MKVMFVLKLLRSMKRLIKLPVMVRVDNIGSVFMGNKITTMLCTKHVDIRHKNVDEYVEDEEVKIDFVKSADNDSNFLTKNLSADLNE